MTMRLTFPASLLVLVLFTPYVLTGHHGETIQEAAPQEAPDLHTAPLPEPNPDQLRTGGFHYRSAINLQGQELTIDAHRTVDHAILDEEPVLRITNDVESAFGSTSDTMDVHPETLRPLRVRFVAGRADGEIEYTDEHISGALRGGGQHLPIDVELEAPVFGHGAGLEVALAALPLEEGFEAPIRYYDPQQQALRVQRMTVSGTNRVTVPAGTFDTWTIELVSVDNHRGGDATVEVLREAPHYVVWSEAAMPAQMGTATSITQLVEIQLDE